MSTADNLVQAPERGEWTGYWTWCDPTATSRNVYALFRRRFRCVSDTLLQVRITADSFYTLFLDGEYVLRGPARAPLSYYSFDTLELAVAAGNHCLAVLAHHVGEVNATMMTGRPGLLADVHYADGGEHDLSTGGDWRCVPAPAWRSDASDIMSHFGFWEERDQRELPANWTAVDFDDGDWQPAVELGRPPCPPWSRLVERDIPLLASVVRPAGPAVTVGRWVPGTSTAEDEIPSATVSARVREQGTGAGPLPFHVDPCPRGGAYVTLDFGRTSTALVTLRLAESHAGQIVEIAYDEVLTNAGAVDPERTNAHMADRYILRGGGETITGAFPRGFRYLTIDMQPGTAPLSLAEVNIREERYPFEVRGRFEAADSQLSTYYGKSAQTVHCSTIDVFTDCVTRERVQWMEDLYLHSQVTFYVFGDCAMVRRALFQAAQCALPDGRINGFFPSERTNCAFAGSSIMWLLLLTDYWQHTAAEYDLRQLLPCAHALLSFIDSQTDAAGLISNWPADQFWDWAPIELTGCLLLTNAAYILALSRLAECAVAEPDARHAWARRVTRLRTVAHERFFDPDTGTYVDAVLEDGARSMVRSQHANSMAVLAGIHPVDQCSQLLARIIAPGNLAAVPEGECQFRPEDRATQTGVVPVGTLWFGYWLCRALFECGLATEALAQMRLLWGAHDHLPLFPELRVPGPNASYCHGWAAGPAALLPAYVLGLQPLAPGWANARFAPQPGALARVTGAVPTPRGVIAATWERARGQDRIRVSAPPGVKVHVRAGETDEWVQG